MSNIRLGVPDPGPESMLKKDPNDQHSFRKIFENVFKKPCLCPLWRCAEGDA
jgi:hypothetical protein